MEYFLSKSSLLKKLIERIYFLKLKLKNPLVGAGFAGEGDLILSLGLHLLQQRLAAVKLIGINCKLQI